MKTVLESLLLPAAISTVVAFAVLHGLRGDLARRYAGALPFAIGFLAAYAVLEPNDWRPSMYWHWLPWVALGGAVVGPIAIAAGVRSPERWALTLLLALVAAWLLVPTRATLLPVRGIYVAAYAGGVTIICVLLDRLASRAAGPVLCGALSLASLSGGALVAAIVSLRFGLLGVAAAAALTGGFLTALWKRDATIIRGLLPAQTAVLGGVLLSAQVNIGLPPAALVLIPTAPLALWLCEAGPLAKLGGKWVYVARFGAVILPLAVAWGLALPALRSEPAW